MAKETEQPDQNKEAAGTPEAAPKSFFTKKLIAFGAIIFVVQFVTLYFITAKVLRPISDGAAGKTLQEETKKEGIPVEPQVFLIKDIIINPAGTNGTRFLLVTVGFEVDNPPGIGGLEKKEVEIRDILNSVLMAKGLKELADVEKREALRDEIAEKVGGIVKETPLKHVYFSKFIIQ